MYPSTSWLVQHGVSLSCAGAWVGSWPPALQAWSGGCWGGCVTALLCGVCLPPLQLCLCCLLAMAAAAGWHAQSASPGQQSLRWQWALALLTSVASWRLGVVGGISGTGLAVQATSTLGHIPAAAQPAAPGATAAVGQDVAAVLWSVRVSCDAHSLCFCWAGAADCSGTNQHARAQPLVG